MAYEKQEWTYEDWLKGRYNVQEKLNHMEDGIADIGQGSASGTVAIILTYDPALERVAPKVKPANADTVAIADYYIKLRDAAYSQLSNVQAPPVMLYDDYTSHIYYLSGIYRSADNDPDSVVLIFANSLSWSNQKYICFYKNGNVELMENL